MKNKILYVFLFVMLFLGCICLSAGAADDISLVIDGQMVECDVPPVAQNGRTLVPVRALFEHLNANVVWDGSLNQVIITSNSTIMILSINSNIVYLNGTSYTMEVSPLIVNERTLIPVRFVTENLGYDVDWDGTTRTVVVTSPKPAQPVEPEPEPDDKPVETPDDKPQTPPEKTGVVLSDVEIKEDDTNYMIVITMAEKITPKVMSLSSPDRLIFDFYGVNQTCKDGKVKSYMSSIVETRWAEHDDYTRLVIESLKKCSYTTKYSNGRFTINIIKPIYTDPSDEPEITLPPADLSPDAPLVVLDPGHGGYDPGAVGRDDDGNIILYEKEVSLKIALKVRNILFANGINVVMTRDVDMALGDTEMKDLLKRADIANEADADLFVSIHQNAFSNNTATGTCVLHAGVAPNEGYGITGKDVAKKIQTYMVEATGLKDRGVVPRPNIVVLKETVMPAVLIECAFISCPTDQQILLDENKLNDISNAISRGIIESLQEMGKL